MKPAVGTHGFALGAAHSRVITFLIVSWFLVGTVGFGLGRDSRMSVTHDAESMTQTTVEMLATQTYVDWWLAHRDRDCPEHIEELFEWMHDKDLTDPWGRDYRFRCRGTKPHMVVWSAGPDRRHGTDDDIRSDR